MPATIDCIELLKHDHNPLAIVYFMSIAGRDDGLQHEWNKGPHQIEIEREKICTSLRYKQPYSLEEIAGKLAFFGIASPQCTRLFWWGKAWGEPLANAHKQYESNLFEFYQSRSPRDLSLSDVFIGCGLENLIIAEETKLWYGAETVEEYYSLPRNPDLKIELKKRDKLGV